VDEVVAYTIGQGTKMQRYYPHYNHLYSVAALTDAAGQVVEKYSYDAYGKQTITGPSGSVRSRSSVGWDRGFTGYVADNETGLLHARARQYSPTLGRFVGRDSYSTRTFAGIHVPMGGAGYQDGPSLYGAYAFPNHLDPSGNVAECEIALFVGHLDEARPWIREQIQDSNGKPIPRPCGSAIGTVSCQTGDVTESIPEEYRIRDYLAAVTNEDENLNCKQLHAQYKQALAKAKVDALRLCKEKCCDYIQISVTCSSDAKDCFGGKRLLPKCVRRGNKWADAGVRENKHYDRTVNDPDACGSVTVVNCPK